MTSNGYVEENFNNVAGIYDFLAYRILGTPYFLSQYSLLPYISDNSTCLIVGGGSGHILKNFKNPHTLTIYYVETSEKMLKMAMEKGNGIGFKKILYYKTVQDVPDNYFDTIITPFLLDLYSGKQLLSLKETLEQKIKNYGYWLIADFEVQKSWPERLWQGLLISLMYTFFNIFCNLKNKRLPSFKHLFDNNIYELKMERYYLRQFIFCRLYQKTA